MAPDTNMRFMKVARVALVASLAVVVLQACSSSDTVVAVNGQINLPPGIAKGDIAVKISQGSRLATANMPVPSYEATIKIPTGMKDDMGADITEPRMFTISYSTAWFDGIKDHGTWFPMRVTLPGGWQEADAKVEGQLSWSALDTATGLFAATPTNFTAQATIPLYPEGAVAAYLTFAPAPPEPPSDGGAGGMDAGGAGGMDAGAGGLDTGGSGGTGTGGSGGTGSGGLGTGGSGGTGTGGSGGTGTGGAANAGTAGN